MERSSRIAIAFALVGALALGLAGPAAARGARVPVQTPAAPGPDEFNRVWVDKYGPKNGKRVLVLIPGTIGSSGDFTLAAKYLVKQVKGLQVWAIDRRSNALEDTTVFAQTLRGEKSLQEMFDYYLTQILTPGGYELVEGASHPYARQWGMATALNDTRAVVQRARGKGARKVILGGHSLGASLAYAYAAWDFNGRPGYKDLAGIVAIDGGLLGSFDSTDTLQQAQDQITQLNASTPFADLLDLGVPEATGLFAEVGGIYARLAPDAPATTLQGSPLLPAQFNPQFSVTNEGLLGFAFDRDTSPASLALIQVNGGWLAASGDPRSWVDDGVTPIARVARTFGQEPANGVEWFFPIRLSIDTNAASAMKPTSAANFLGLRLLHTDKIDDPLYAIQTDLTDGRVLQGARNLIARSRTTRKESTLVNADPINSHFDPLIAAPKSNRFYKTVDDFLREAFSAGKGKGRGKKR